MSTNIAKGIEIAKRATECDVKGEYAKASELYIKSLDFFLVALKAEKDSARKELIRSKMKEYLDRAEFIKANCLQSTPPMSSGAGKPPPRQAHPSAPSAPPPSSQQQQHQPAVQPRAPSGGSGGYYEGVIMQAMRYDEIVQECKRQRIRFTDPLFRADTTSLFKGNPSNDALELSRKVVWMRATEKLGGKPKMFQAAIDPCDVVQGSLGDCWFL